MYILTVPVLGVVAAVVATFILGMLWYSPLMFGKKWMALMGMTMDMGDEMKKNARRAYIINVLFSILTAYILAVFLKNTLLLSYWTAMKIGFLAWLGFVAPALSTEYVFAVQKRPWSLYAINIGYQLTSLLLQSFVLYYFLT